MDTWLVNHMGIHFEHFAVAIINTVTSESLVIITATLQYGVLSTILLSVLYSISDKWDYLTTGIIASDNQTQVYTTTNALLSLNCYPIIWLYKTLLRNSLSV